MCKLTARVGNDVHHQARQPPELLLSLCENGFYFFLALSQVVSNGASKWPGQGDCRKQAG